MNSERINTIKQAFSMSKFTIEHWYAWILGLVFGCIAYVNGVPGFIEANINLHGAFEKIGSAVWAFVVAIISTLGGLAAKYVWDKRLKKWFSKMFEIKKSTNYQHQKSHHTKRK